MGLAKNPKRAKRNAQIKRAAKTGRHTQAELAERFQVSQGRISQVLNDDLCHATKEDILSLI